MPGDALTPAGDGVWLATEPVRIVGTHLSTNMTVLRLDDGDLVLVSPVPMTAERRAAVDGLGRVAHLYAPNALHHLWIGDWARAYPAAKLHAPAALAKKRPDLRIDRAHDVAPEPAFAGALVERPIAGSGSPRPRSSTGRRGRSSSPIWSTTSGDRRACGRGRTRR